MNSYNLKEVADRHPGVRREREARKRGPRHRFCRSVAVRVGLPRVPGVPGVPRIAIPRGRGRKNILNRIKMH